MQTFHLQILQLQLRLNLSDFLPQRYLTLMIV